MQFPLDTIAEVAQILQNQNLGEITLETAGARLTLKRANIVAPFAAPVEEVGSEETVSNATEAPAVETITVVSPAVGVFRDAKNPLQIGATIARKASLGAVETLNIPTELVAPQNARITEILAIDGQGVEWGQPLLILEPVE